MVWLLRKMKRRKRREQLPEFRRPIYPPCCGEPGGPKIAEVLSGPVWLVNGAGPTVLVVISPCSTLIY